MKSRIMRWAGHVVCIGTEEVHTRLWWRKQCERDHWQDPDVDGGIIVKWIFRKWDGGAWTDLAQDWDRWWALVNAAMNTGFHKMRRIF
jgi:hypothetical protein